MSNVEKYIVKPETIVKEVRQRSRKLLAARSFLLFLASLAAFAAYFSIYVSLGFELPKTTVLKKTNAIWLSRMEMLNSQMDALDESLAELQLMDDDVYRSVFGMNEIPMERRESGLAGASRYDEYTNPALRETVRRLDMLSKKAYVQSRSYDEVSSLAARAGNMASCIPAIPPMLPDRKRFSVSSPFGYRVDPHYKYRKLHTGVDFSMKSGNPIYAVGDGVVKEVKHELFGYGNSITIDHGFGYMTRYAHLKVTEVVVGMPVKRGQRIALSGNSGKTTGAHLHYEVIYRNAFVNPMLFLDLDMPVDEYEQLINSEDLDSGYIAPEQLRSKTR